MTRPNLPKACHWAGTPAAPLLMYNYGVIAYITPAEGAVPMQIHLNFLGSHIQAIHRGGILSAKRFIERWVAARISVPRRDHQWPAGRKTIPDATFRVITALAPSSRDNWALSQLHEERTRGAHANRPPE
ncbi:hypothetical protein [Stenotrophomonas sp. SY1]|uniref:hypothetical protein n=1 Tax=Stenotrophomonas sp. SY1 TaxID=477235 RepID=UPI001E4CE66D|nr:hypothetical protein [Stenotrophomonas sp. SY1]MCD9086238.1 hypothetical protein [Stenotrophomonas sp. SY1]